MTVMDAPDGQRGTVATAKLLATVPSGTASKSVTLPSNARNLIVLMPQSASAYVPTVTGSTSGMNYPGTLLPVGAFETADECYVTLVWPAVDAVVDVAFDATPAVDWYILADNADRVMTELTLRSAMGGAGASKPIDGILVLGADSAGTARTLLIDDTGKLVTTGGSVSLTYEQSFITATVSLATDTATEITSIVCAAGTWDLSMSALIEPTAAQIDNYMLWVDTVSAATSNPLLTARQVSWNTGGDYLQLANRKVVVLNGSTTLYLNVVSYSNTATVAAAAVAGWGGITTGITAVKIA